MTVDIVGVFVKIPSFEIDGSGNKLKWLKEVLTLDMVNSEVMKEAKEFLDRIVGNTFSD